MSVGQLPAETDNYERRDSSAGMAFIPAIMLGALGRLLGSLERAFIAADVLFPAFAVGLLYMASAGMVRSRSARLLIAWGTLLIPFAPRTFFWLGSDSLLGAPEFTRTPQPEISFTLLLLTLLVTASALEPSAKRSLSLVAGLLGALVVYSYYFYAIAWSTTLGLLLVLMIAWGNIELSKRTLIMLSTMVFLSIPYILATIRGNAEGGQTYLLARVGEYTHAPRLVPLFCFAVGLILLWKLGKRPFWKQVVQIRVEIFMLLLLSGLAGLNFQVFSGFDALHHGHFWRRVILPVIFFLSGCLLLSATEKRWNRPRILNGVLVGIIICILVNAAVRQVAAGIRIAEWQRASRAEIELLKWIRSNLPAGSVIGTVDPDLILLIPAISANYTYVPAGLRSLTPTGEIIHRYYELASLLGLSADQIDSIASASAHQTTDSQLLLVLRVHGDSKGLPQLHDNEDLQLVWLERYDETRRTFSEGYRQYQQLHVGDGGRRLDYVVSSAGVPIPTEIVRRFVHARILHRNGQYQLIALR